MSAHSHQSAASPLSAKRARPLKGRVRPPGDKSISHRAFLLGLLTCGETKVEGLLEGDDVLRTGKACQALGAVIERLGPGAWRIRGPGIGALLAPRETLDFGNAGTGCRLMMGVVGGHGITATFDGDASLRKRPMRRILDPLRLMGAQVLSEAEGGRCPDRAQGRPRSRADRISHARRLGSDQVGRPARRPQRAGRDDGDRRPKPRATTPRRCSPISAPRSRSSPRARGGGSRSSAGPELRPTTVVVPGDPSSAAFPIVAALIVPGSDIVVEGMMMNPLQDRASPDAEGDGRPYRDARLAARGRRGGRGLAGARGHASRASTFRPRAPPR